MFVPSVSAKLVSCDTTETNSLADMLERLLAPLDSVEEMELTRSLSRRLA